MSPWWRVGAWWMGLFGLGWCCLASAIDRLAGQGVLTGPSALQSGGHALAARAALALEAGRASDAAGLGRSAVARAPIDPAVLRVAGAAALATGDATAGDRLLRLAGAAGWRDMPTQHYWATMSIRAGAWDAAVERLDAALRIDPGDRVAAAALRIVERDAAGQAALLRRLAVPNNWAADWLATLDGADQAARLRTVHRLWPGLPPVTRDRIAWALVTAGEARQALALVHPARNVASFATAREGAGPFEWSLMLSAGLDADTTPTGLHVQATGMAPVPVASTMIVPSPGLSRLTIAVAGARTDLPLLVTLECAAGGPSEVEPLATPPGLVAVAMRAPAACGVGRLTIAVAGGEAALGADLRLGAVMLSRAP